MLQSELGGPWELGHEAQNLKSRTDRDFGTMDGTFNKSFRFYDLKSLQRESKGLSW